MKADYFQALYAHHLRAVIRENPQEYSPFINPDQTALKMTAALRQGTANIRDADAMRRLMREVAPKVPFTNRAVQEWFNEHVTFDA